jgi:hypothetical protein
MFSALPPNWTLLDAIGTNGADPDTIAIFGLCFRIDGQKQT